MSAIPNPTGSPQLRLVTSTLNVKHGALSNNLSFNTNLPAGAGMSPNLAIQIDRIQFVMAVKDAPAGADSDFQVIAELTENTANTTVNQKDPLAISFAFYEERTKFTTSGEPITFRNPIRDLEDDFGGPGQGWLTVAQSLNFVVSMVEVVGSGPATNGVDVFLYIWYHLVNVTPAVQQTLVNRLALQR